MNELNVAPAATETADTAAPAVAEPSTTEGVVQTDKPTEKVEKTAEQKELEYLRRSRTKAERNNARLYQELQEAKRAREAPPAGEKLEVDANKLDEVISTRAKEYARVEKLNERCNDIANQGHKAFADFDSALSVLREELPLFTNTGPTPAMEAILEMDNPSALIHYLGKNPDVAAELSDLSPYRLTRRLDQIERDMKPTRQVSNAPKPLEPVKASASPSGEPDAKDTAKWIAWRNKQTAKS